MIVAGIDEAGYGPLLGPLVVGCSAFEVPGDPDGELPCVWKLLRKHVSRNRSKTGRKIHVNDSKQVYSPGIGLKELERSVLTILAASGEFPEALGDLLARLCGPMVEAIEKYPWYVRPDGEAFPFEQEAISIRLLANALRLEMQRVGTRCVHAGAQLVCEAELNRMFDATRNKGSVLFSQAASHIDRLLNSFADQGLIIVCDRHGGREHYGSLLRLMFPEWSLEIDHEESEHSQYRLCQGKRTVIVHFREKAEAQCLSVAFASMISKYLREAMMRRFNAWWSAQMPGIAPTAGYHGDGTRFLGQIDRRRREMGIADEQLIRSR